MTTETSFGAVQRELMGDIARLQQVIWNLPRNAVGFTPAGGKVAIRARDIPATGGNAWRKTDVTHSAIGIDPGCVEPILRPFNQGGATGDEWLGGLGLGLFNARAVGARHGGEISVQSERVDRGFTFLVRRSQSVTAPSRIAHRDRPAKTTRSAVHR